MKTQDRDVNAKPATSWYPSNYHPNEGVNLEGVTLTRCNNRSVLCSHPVSTGNIIFILYIVVLIHVWVATGVVYPKICLYEHKSASYTSPMRSNTPPFNRWTSIGKLLRRIKSSRFHFTPQRRCVTDASWSHSRWWCVCPASGLQRESTAAASTVCVSAGLVQAAEATVTAAETGAPLRCISMRTGGRMFFSHFVCSHREPHVYLINTAQCLFSATLTNKKLKTEIISRETAWSIDQTLSLSFALHST